MCSALFLYQSGFWVSFARMASKSGLLGMKESALSVSMYNI